VLVSVEPAIRKLVAATLALNHGIAVVEAPDTHASLDAFDRVLFGGRFSAVYVLAGRPVQEPLATLVAQVPFRIGDYVPDALPMRPAHATLRLYRIERYTLLLRAFGWTNGDQEFPASYEVMPSDRHLILRTMDSHPMRHDDKKLNLRVSVNDQPLVLLKREGIAYTFELPRGLRRITSLHVSSTVFVPRELGMGEDARELGIDVDDIRVSPAL
jgi:hypothetical protein